MKQTLHALVRSRGFLVMSLAAVWFCFYAVLSSSDRQETPSRDNGTPVPVVSLDESVEDESDEQTDVFERVYDVFNIPGLKISGLARILRDEGVNLTYPASLDSLTFEAFEYGGNSLGEILIEILRPHSYGFYCQGNDVCIIEMQTDRQRALEGTDEKRYRLSNIQTTLEARVDDPIDLWIETDPTIRLRIVAQPLYGESTEGWVGLNVEARREGRLWLYESTNTQIGSEALLHSSSCELVWLTIKILSLKDSKIAIEVRFQHETTVPSS